MGPMFWGNQTWFKCMVILKDFPLWGRPIVWVVIAWHLFKDKLERKIWEKPMVCFPMFSWNIWYGFTHNFAVASGAATGILASGFSDLLEFSHGKMDGRWTTMLIHLEFWLILFKGVVQMGGPYASKMMLIFLYGLLHEEYLWYIKSERRFPIWWYDSQFWLAHVFFPTGHSTTK